MEGCNATLAGSLSGRKDSIYDSEPMKLKETQTRVVIDRLHKDATGLDDALTELEARLDPILQRDQKEMNPCSEPTPILVPLAEELGGIDYRFGRSLARVRSILGRLEL